MGGSGLNSFNVFIGPKDSQILRSINPKLDQLIDWGTWFGFIAKPLFYVLTWTAKHVTGENFGWAIIVVTIAINMVLFPLRFSSMRSSKKMQALQPQIAAINAKYKDLPMRDPRKQEQQAEMMDLYKKNGVNPVGGCVPMIIQLPFLIAYYTVLGVAIELRGANWLWVHDLSQARNAGHPCVAGSAGGHTIRAAKDDTQPGHGSGTAEDDAVHAAGAGLHVLLPIGGTGTILVDRRSGGYRTAVVAQSGHACSSGSCPEPAAKEEEIAKEEIGRRNRT